MYVLPLGDSVMRGWVHIGYDRRGWFVGVAIAINIGFYVAIRNRHTQRFADPGLMAATARKSRRKRAPRLGRCNVTRHLASCRLRSSRGRSSRIAQRSVTTRGALHRLLRTDASTGASVRMLELRIGASGGAHIFLKSFFGEVGNPHPGANCQGDDLLAFEARMAFQPIVDSASRTVFAYEALVRGMEGEGADGVIARVRPEQMYRFDQTCRVMAIAIATAAALRMQTRLSINFNPNAVYEPATCIRLTLAAAERCGFDAGRLIFEVTESERIRDTPHLVRIRGDYQRRGFMTAIDDFGAGYAGLNLLAEFQPDIVKLDMALIRDIDSHQVRRSIIAGIVTTCRALGCEILAEGVETAAEYRTLRTMGITLFQGYLFARPGLETLAEVDAALWDLIESGPPLAGAG